MVVGSNPSGCMKNSKKTMEKHMTKYELPDCWYYEEDGGGFGEWFLMSGTIIARIIMHVPGNMPILADCITYKATLWTNQTIIATSEYKSLEKAKSGCEEQIRKYLEFLDSTKERVEDEPETKIDELEAKCVESRLLILLQTNYR